MNGSQLFRCRGKVRHPHVLDGTFEQELLTGGSISYTFTASNVESS